MQLRKQGYVLLAVAVLRRYSTPFSSAADIKEGKWRDEWKETKKQIKKMDGKKEIFKRIGVLKDIMDDYQDWYKENNHN